MKPLLRRLACVTAFLTNAVGLWGQAVFTESFKGTTADGWVFGGNYTPNLTANTIDAPGDGWLRLTDNATNRATYAFLDTEIFSVNAQINITMEYAFYNGSGADGITFFLVDGGINASTFDPGSYGGSMGYAQRTGESGMAGGYLGFALDNFGNYSNASEGRNGGLSTSGTLYPNRVAVRGPESSGYEFIAASSALPQQMDFPTSTTRPDQTGADYRAFQIVLDANNQLEVFMKFGASNDFSSVFTADLSGYERPETFKLGFTGATGDSTEIHEIRNLQVTTTPFQEGAFEWDDGGGSDNSAGTAANWVGDVLPTDNSDILFGSKPAANSTQVVDVPVDGRVRSLTFDSSSNYQLVGAGELTLGNSLQTGKPSINVNEYNNAYARHKIDNDLRLAEELRINNYSLSTLCLNGTIQTVYDDNLSSSTNSTIHDIIVNGHGAVNFNGDILGSGDLIKNGSGITTINNNNADGSSWSGDVKINAGQVVVTTNGALGNTTGTTTVADGATLTFRGGVNYTTAEAVTITGRGVSRGIDQSAGALHNDGGNNTFAGSVTLAGNAAVGSREGTLTLTGALGGGSKNLTKVGAGTVSIESASGGLYSGAFIIEEGALRFNASSFSTAMNYNLAGGVLEIGGDFYTSGAGDVAMNLGTGNNAIRWTGDGGFSATGADRTIYLNYNTSAVTWGSTANFLGNGSALLFGSTTSTHTATLMNGITLGSQQREIRVANGSGVIDGGIAGAITGTGGIIKTGEGTLNLTGSNTYSGATEIKAGALRGNVSTASNLQLNGGVREVSANTSLTLGTAGGNVRWTGDGGFAAAGAASSLTLNSGASLTWGTTSHFVGASNTLTFGSVSASNTLTLTNSLALGTSGTRTIRTIQGTNSSVASGALSGVVSGSAALSVTGNGRLDLTGVNTNTGLVTIAGSEVRLTGAGTMVSVADSGSTAGFTVQQGGRLYLDNSGSTLDRIGNATDIALNGGRLDLIGRTNSTATTETVGVLKLTGGENQINVQRAGSNATVLAFDSLSRSNGATLEFTNDSGSGILGETGSNPRVSFTTSPTMEQGILAYAVAGNGSTPTGFATLNSGRVTIAAVTNTAQSAWIASTIAAPATDQILNTNRNVGALVLGSGVDVTQSASSTLTVQTGGILSTGGSVSNLAVSTLQVGGTGNRELFTHVYGSGGLNISASIQNNGNVTGLTKSGSGTLTLSGTTANTFTGMTYVNDGTLVLNKTAGVTAIAGDIIVGDGRGVDTLRFGTNEQLANTSDLTLRGGLAGAAASALNQAVLDMNGTTQTFRTLTVEGNSVIDFSGGDVCAPTFLNLTDINFVGDATLTIKNWVEFTDFFLVQSNATVDFSRIIFEGYGSQANWQDYSSGWKQLTPVPEPSTYGAIFVGSLAGLFWFRRRAVRAGK